MAGSHQNGPIHRDLHGEWIQFNGCSGSGDPRVSSARSFSSHLVELKTGGGRRKTRYSKICKDEAAERENIILCLQSAVSLIASLLITNAGKIKIYNHYTGSKYFVSFTHRN